jgi:hypothetical protein
VQTHGWATRTTCFPGAGGGGGGGGGGTGGTPPGCQPR